MIAYRHRFGFRDQRPVFSFTLLEVLVVTAILGVLAAVLAPVFLSAQEKSRQSVCVSNLSQLYKAVALYAGDNDGFRPMYGVGASSDWVDSQEVTRPDQSAELVQSLQPYTRASDIWFCPDDPLRGNSTVFKRHPATSYACQTAFTVRPFDPTSPLPLFLIGRNLARTPLFADDILLCIPQRPPATYLYTHNQHFNVVFSDGHVQTENTKEATSIDSCH